MLYHFRQQYCIYIHHAVALIQGYSIQAVLYMQGDPAVWIAHAVLALIHSIKDMLAATALVESVLSTILLSTRPEFHHSAPCGRWTMPLAECRACFFRLKLAKSTLTDTPFLKG